MINSRSYLGSPFSDFGGTFVIPLPGNPSYENISDLSNTVKALIGKPQTTGFIFDFGSTSLMSNRDFSRIVSIAKVAKMTGLECHFVSIGAELAAILDIPDLEAAQIRFWPDCLSALEYCRTKL